MYNSSRSPWHKVLSKSCHRYGAVATVKVSADDHSDEMLEWSHHYWRRQCNSLPLIRIRLSLCVREYCTDWHCRLFNVNCLSSCQVVQKNAMCHFQQSETIAKVCGRQLRAAVWKVLNLDRDRYDRLTRLPLAFNNRTTEGKLCKDRQQPLNHLVKNSHSK